MDKGFTIGRSSEAMADPGSVAERSGGSSEGRVRAGGMKSLIKTFSKALLIVPLRWAVPAIENVRRLHAYLLLSARLNHILPNSVVLLGGSEVRGTGEVRIGENVLLYPDCYFETQSDASVNIGDNVVLSRGVHLVAYSGISIGEGSMIGEYSSIRDANHLRSADASLRDGLHRSSPITIGTRAWIGRGVTILPGVSIGDYATVGANAVVTRDVAAGATVVGIPAAPIHSTRDQGSESKAAGSTDADASPN